jgi:hypothetical protein
LTPSTTTPISATFLESIPAESAPFGPKSKSRFAIALAKRIANSAADWGSFSEAIGVNSPNAVPFGRLNGSLVLPATFGSVRAEAISI